jgi:chromosomal replication initiator protein
MPDTIWLEAQRRLRGELGHKDYETWIEPLRAARWGSGTLTLEAPSTFARDWLKNHFIRALEGAVAAATGGPASVVLVVNRELSVPADARSLPPRRAERRPGGATARFTFETFVVGTSNRLAYQAARTVVAQPGARFNPLFLYGGCGLGKTHLLGAVANALAIERPLGSVACLSAENFVNEMILAIEGRRMERFRQKFRGIHTLVIDDVQFLAEKRRSQEEFGHTFNALHDGSRQIVIASDRAPHDMPGIEDALRDRFACGLLARIEKPDADLRLALVARKAEASGLALEDGVGVYLADHWCANVRVLEGALNRLGAFAALAGRAITLGLAREALGAPPAGAHGQNGRVSVDRIIGEVCRHYQLTRAEIGSARRTARVALPRQVAMYLCREHTEAPLNRIGAELGGRDHSTVVHALGAIERRLQSDAAVREAVAALRARLRA